jgi:hypothetical protein
MYCHAKGCRDYVTSNGNGPFCFTHQQENILLAQKDAVYLHGQGFGHATCHVCFLPQEFHRGVFSKHDAEDGPCDGGGQEIAVFKTPKKTRGHTWNQSR